MKEYRVSRTALAAAFMRGYRALYDNHGTFDGEYERATAEIKSHLTELKDQLLKQTEFP